MQSKEIRERFLKFFEKRGHTIIPSSSLVPENDPSVLFNTAGMQPLVPYLLGAKHPTGATRLADSQKCVRTNDIDEIGDNTHATFFEMLGNWSLGDYFKEEAIKWSFEFLASKEEGLGLDPKRLYVTVFEGDENAPRDDEAFEIWKKYLPENRIYFMSAKSNWWSPGDNGPCGPDSEMFYDVTEKGLGDMTKEEYLAADDRQDVVEIWNDVFMEYEKKDGKVVGKLPQKNVDTGSGLERVTMVVQGKNNIYDTDLLSPIVQEIQNSKSQIQKDERSARIIADHLRTSVFMIADGVIPSNTDRGYILRRLLRRIIRHADALGVENLSGLVNVVADIYKTQYPVLTEKQKLIEGEIKKEEAKFRKTLKNGLQELSKMAMDEFEEVGKEHLKITGNNLFYLYATHGFPFELSVEELNKIFKELRESGYSSYEDLSKEEIQKIYLEFEEEMKRHQEVSRQGSEQKFKGGLADTSEMSTRYHTATHLLHKALREVLGDKVFQKGSNITPERMRFDFSYPEKMTDEQKKMVEDLVNEKIKEALPVSFEDVSFDEAKKRNAMGLFENKYGDMVRVYTVGEGDKKWSVEICGGPHVQNTSELGHFKILKEESVAQGVRRIKAVLE